MLDRLCIQEISKKSKAEKWPFPRSFEALKKAGLKSYVVDLMTRKIIFNGDEDNFVEDMGGNSLVSNEVFNTKLFKEVLMLHQTQKTSYEEFLKGIASAGIVSYRVDFERRTVSYFGKEPSQEIVEKVPTFD